MEGLTTIDAAVAAAVEEELADFVGSAPELLRSLADFAAAIGNDPNFAATIFAQLGFRLRVDTDQGLSPAQMQRGRANLGLDKVSNLAPGEYPVSSLQASAIAAAVATEASARSAAIAQLVGSAPEFLDTFAEIAAAIGNNPNFLTTILTALGLRLRVDAPQGLSAEQKLQGKTNLGLDTLEVDIEALEDEVVLLDGKIKDEETFRKQDVAGLQGAILEEATTRQTTDNEHHARIVAAEGIFARLMAAFGASVDAIRMLKEAKYRRSGIDAATIDAAGRLFFGWRRRDSVMVVGGEGVETNSWRLIEDHRFRRSGMIAAVVDRGGRLISGLRQRDQTYVLPARALEVGATTRIDSGAKFARSGIAAAVVDQSGRLIRGQDVAARRERLGAAGVATRYQAWDGLNPASLSRSGYIKATVNEDRRVIDAVKTSGVGIVNGREVAVPSEAWKDYVVYTKMVGGFQHVFSERRETGVRLQLSRSGTENANPRFEPDGSVVWEQLTDDFGRVLWTSAADSVTTRRVFPMIEMLGAGDSLVEANYGAQLATLAGIPYRNIGRSGATSANVATRLGGRRMRLASVTGFIPASGSVEVDSLDGLGVLSFYGDASVSNVPGSWAGVPGTLSWDKPTRKITFARTTDGAAVVVRGGIPFEPLIVENGTGAALPDLLQRILVFGFGRNDMENYLRIFANLQAVVAAIPTIAKHWVFVLPMPSKSEVLGNWAGYQSYLALKALCLAAYPNNTFDMLGHFLTQANGTTADQAAVAAGYPPPSLMESDEIHPNALGRTAEANGLYNHLNAKGYF
ncbi:hypothetical protein [Rhizobium sp. NFR03]|uniref:hypothetical protein n=1 Tax=Rhizobium sp. NFR03 TaxID=1566263 RepID=UPI0011148A68|nr:hypothetical protein [Rhizobium sp. NFR03]